LHTAHTPRRCVVEWVKQSCEGHNWSRVCWFPSLLDCTKMIRRKWKN
jgi:hypothetical protein